MKLDLYDIKYFNIVEFNITGDRESFQPGDPDSKFLDTEVFNLFIHCFEKSNKLFDYYEPTKFNARTLIPLKHSLTGQKSSFLQVKDAKEFISMIQKTPLGSEFIEEIIKTDPRWKGHWDIYRSHLVRISDDLVKLVDRCMDEDKILWVKGY
jgi:hypothetical protein